MLDIIAGVGARGFLLTEPDCSLILEGKANTTCIQHSFCLPFVVVLILLLLPSSLLLLLLCSSFVLCCIYTAYNTDIKLMIYVQKDKKVECMVQ